MKTLVHFAQGAALVALLLVLGCQKETPTPSNCKKPAPPSAQPKACDPWRNVTGFTALFAELNGFAICDYRDCMGGSVTTTLINYTLDNPSTSSDYLIASNQVVTPAEQNAIMSAALAWAVANTPAGYFVSGISYSQNILVGPPPVTSGITITVLYRKCTGGGGGEG